MTTFVVVGAGLGGGTTAAKLREEGFDGDLVLIGAEPMPPYERPPLSKEYLRGESDHHFVRPSEWYEEHAIDARFDVKAERVNVTDRVVELEGGERVPFDQVVIATGARNRKPKIEGLSASPASSTCATRPTPTRSSRRPRRARRPSWSGWGSSARR